MKKRTNLFFLVTIILVIITLYGCSELTHRLSGPENELRELSERIKENPEDATSYIDRGIYLAARGDVCLPCGILTEHWI